MVRVIVLTFLGTLITGMPIAFVLGVTAAVALTFWGRTPCWSLPNACSPASINSL